MTESGEYVLGVSEVELRRLAAQHTSWVEQAYAVWRRAGFRKGDALLDLGCGPGFTSFDLARLVGPEGRIVARDQSAWFLEALASERDRLGLSWVEPSHGTVEELDFEAGSFDGAYARWLFCWLEDPRAALARVAECVKPGGAIAIQDYLHWGAMRLVPQSAAFDRIVSACLRSWKLDGVAIDVAGVLPTLAREVGLTVEEVRPLARMGGVRSLEWDWIGGFVGGYSAKLVDQGLATRDEVAELRRDWAERAAEGTSLVFAPVVADVLLRRA